MNELTQQQLWGSEKLGREVECSQLAVYRVLDFRGIANEEETRLDQQLAWNAMPSTSLVFTNCTVSITKESLEITYHLKRITAESQ